MAFNPTFKVKLLEVLDSAYESDALKNRLREFVTDTEFKQLFGFRIVDKIVERTESGIDKKNKPFPAYSETYKESLMFQIYKGGQTQVDLRLTGEMLESITPKMGRFEIIVGIEGQNNKDKAQGHITGRYGKKGRSRPRDFLGLPRDVLAEEFRQAMKDYRSGSLQELEALPDAA